MRNVPLVITPTAAEGLLSGHQLNPPNLRSKIVTPKITRNPKNLNDYKRLM